MRPHPKANPFQARVTITTKAGKKYVEDIGVFKNLPNLAKKKTMTAEKFFDNVIPVLGKKKAEQIK